MPSIIEGIEFMKNKLLLGALLSAAPFASAIWQPADIAIPTTKSGKRGILVMPSLESHVGYRAFDADGVKGGLDTLLFTQAFTIGDVFLASRLAAAGKLQSWNNVTPSDTLSYLGTLATAKVNIVAEQQCARLGFNGAFTFKKNLVGNDVLWTMGYAIPVEYYEHKMDLTFSDVQVGIDVDFLGHTGAIDQFVTNYADMYEFFNQDVVELKGLAFNTRQRSLGIGSVKLFSMLDWKGMAHRDIEQFQLAVVLGLPTGTTPDGNVVWPIERSASGAMQLGAHGNVQWKIASHWNPFIKFEVTGRFAKNVYQRVPKKKTFAAGTSLFTDGILANDNFTDVAGAGAASRLLNAPIDEYDSLIPFFADQRVMTSRRLGIILNFECGNTIKTNAFDVNLAYNLYYTQKDKITVSSDAPAGVYNTDVLTANTKQLRHSFKWEAVYVLRDNTFLSLGSQHVVHGHNTPQYHAGMLSFVSTF